MVERVRVRCSTCRAVVPVTLLWASGDACPRCGTPVPIATDYKAVVARREAEAITAPPLRRSA